MSISVLIASDFVLSPALESEWLGRLPQQRRAEICRWPDRRARHRSLLASRLLREGLKRLGYPAADLASLRYPPRSRPTLALPIDFSVSHCDGRILCAISTCGPIGVDVEALDALTAENFHIYLSAAERAWAGRNASRFYSIWTRKEAVAKAAGTSGLPVLGQVDTMSRGQTADFAGQTWQTSTIPVGRGYVAHLAFRARPADVIFERIPRCRLEREARVDEQPTRGHASCVGLPTLPPTALNL
jgi:4'-phosphopantetheinyl transferase